MGPAHIFNTPPSEPSTPSQLNTAQQLLDAGSFERCLTAGILQRVPSINLTSVPAEEVRETATFNDAKAVGLTDGIESPWRLKRERKLSLPFWI